MIHAEGLTRTFRTRTGPVEAVRGVDIDVKEGEIVGFLGPNGAGKTTTLRMLTTLLAPTSGRATVAGCDLRTDPVRGAPPDRLRRPGRVDLPRGPGRRGGGRPGPALRHPPRGGHRARARTVRPTRPRRSVGPHLRLAVRRAAAPARHRDGAGPLPRSGLPRRAHHGAGPAVAGQPLGARAPVARRGHDRLPHHALPRGGGHALRPDPGDRQRSDRGLRPAGRAQAPGLR